MPADGVPAAAIVAEHIHLHLDVLVVSKITLPFARLLMAFFLALTLAYGAIGVWVAMVISMAFQGLLMARRFHKGRWKELKLE